ncbi:PhzF family phenazine biosynthesis protein [Acinetobacter baumannii]
MQDIAAFAGYSETAFCFVHRKIRAMIYMFDILPSHEVPICGHATIATHFYVQLQATNQTIH